MAQQDTQAAGSGFDSGAIQALRNRAITGMLCDATQPSISAGEVGFSFWRGYVKALKDVSSGCGGTLAQMDAIHSGYEPPSHLQAAFAALSEHSENLTFSEVQKLYTSTVVQISADAVTNGKVNAGQQLVDGEGLAVHLHDEHASAVVDGDDGPLHGDASLTATVSQEGGAA